MDSDFVGAWTSLFSAAFMVCADVAGGSATGAVEVDDT